MCTHTHTNPNIYMDSTHTKYVFCSWTFPHLKNENGTVVRLQSEKAKAASTYKLRHVDMFVFQCWEYNKCVTCPPHASSSERWSSIPSTAQGSSFSCESHLGPLVLERCFWVYQFVWRSIHPSYVMAPSSNVLCKQISQFGHYRLRDRCGTSSFAN